MAQVTSNISIESARIGFRNFSGEYRPPYNPAGRRNFAVFLDYDMGVALEQDGWRVKWLKPREEDDSPQPFLPVAVAFENFPPKIIMITSRGKTIIDESTCNILDWAEVKNVDLILRPYNWKNAMGEEGVKAYLKTMYITVVEDEFEAKYQDVDSM